MNDFGISFLVFSLTTTKNGNHHHHYNNKHNISINTTKKSPVNTLLECIIMQAVGPLMRLCCNSNYDTILDKFICINIIKKNLHTKAKHNPMKLKHGTNEWWHWTTQTCLHHSCFLDHQYNNISQLNLPSTPITTHKRTLSLSILLNLQSMFSGFFSLCLFATINLPHTQFLTHIWRYFVLLLPLFRVRFFS